MELAAHFGITKYPAPAGGCLLTDPRYASRLKELLARVSKPSRRELEILKWGRHFRLPGGAKVVVGRTHKENEALKPLLVRDDLVLRVQGHPGPLVMVLGEAAGEGLEQAALLTASYSDAPLGLEVTVAAQSHGETRLVRVTPTAKDRFKEWLI
jgi:hypothetical protein